MKKILLVMGSPRVQGNTYALYSHFRDILHKDGIVFDSVEVGLEKTIQPCSHCGACHKVGKCVKKDSFEPVISNFKDYSHIVWFTPIYFFQLTSQSKAFLDRLYGTKSEDWSHKKLFVFAISGSEGYFGGADIVSETFIRSAEYIGFEYIGMYNKVTHDEILKVDSKDKETMISLVNSIKRDLQ